LSYDKWLCMFAITKQMYNKTTFKQQEVKTRLTDRKNTHSIMTQAEKLGKVLNEMKADITAEDRRECMIKLGVHPNTIQNYINGVGRDPSLAAKMITIYKKQIDKRNQVIA